MNGDSTKNISRSKAIATASKSSGQDLSWATVIQRNPNPKIVQMPIARGLIQSTKLPWWVRDIQSGIDLLLVPPGKFLMGASKGDKAAQKDELPQHSVTISRPFYLGRTPVTEKSWNLIMGTKSTRLDNPVDHASWDDCMMFCERSGFQLPTEAQWEYACRAGTSTPRYARLEEIGGPVEFHTGQQRLEGPYAVGLAKPNLFGLHDLLGNVWEWCSDWYNASYYQKFRTGVVDPGGPINGNHRVLRGGYEGQMENTSMDCDTSNCRASARRGYAPKSQFTAGLRVSRSM